MRERGLTFLLALAALAAFYALWLRPAPSLDTDADSARPTTAERRGAGYAALFEWLERSGVGARSWRERYTALAELDGPPRGNLLVITLPGVEAFRNEEFAALDKWVRRGNTLLINAALFDQPGWAAGREAGVVGEVESLTSLEFETRATREARLDDTPLAQRVREADARDARDDEEPGAGPDAEPDSGTGEATGSIMLAATGPHALLDGVQQLALETDYPPHEWSLRLPYDNFVLTLARGADGEGALFEQRLGAGRILLAAGGTLFSNRALGEADNARLFGNIVSITMSPGGVVLFDDLRQGLSANYNPARFYSDPRLYRTVFILLGLWLAWVLGGTRLRAPVVARHDPSEADLVRYAGGLISRTVTPWRAALAMFDDFFLRVARAAGDARSADRAELWHWLERHAAIRPQDLDQLKSWYADAHAERKLSLVSLQNLFDSLEQRLKK